MKAFMAITAHGITPDWNVLDLLVAMPSVEGVLSTFYIKAPQL